MSVLGPLGLLPVGAAVTGSARLGGVELDRYVASVICARRARGGGSGVVFQDPYGALNPLRTVGSQVDEAVAQR